VSPLVTVIVDSQKKVTPEGKSLAQGHPDFQCVERLWDVLYSDGDRLKVTIELFDGYGAVFKEGPAVDMNAHPLDSERQPVPVQPAWKRDATECRFSRFRVAAPHETC
jgi:hypothetical protein